MSGRSLPVLGCGAAALLATLPAAEAGGFALREQSAYGQGLSFAGVAAGGSLSSMFWNPATLSAVMGFEVEKVGTLILPVSDVEVDGVIPDDEGDIAQDAFVPAGYGAYRLNDRLVLGVGLNGPFGLATKYDFGSPLRATGVAGTSKVFSLNLSPSVSYQVNDWLALAFGGQIQHAKVRLTAVGPFGLEGDDIAAGVTAGILLTPRPGTEIGLGYRSRIDHELEGELSTTGLSFDVTGDGLDLPDLVTFGVRQQVTESLVLSAGAEWSNWSRFQTVELSDGPIPELPFEYNDGWFFSVGVEYQATERLNLRAGVGYELSPIDDGNRTFRLPDNDRLWLSAGAGYDWSDRVSLDLGYSFLKSADTDILAAGDGGPEANGPFFGEADAQVHILAAGVKIKFGGHAAVEPPAPMIVKR